MKKEKLFVQFFLSTMIMLLATTGASAQVTIGSGKVPESFSVLELISEQKRGFRLPQMNSAERDAMQATFENRATTEAMGLMIYNTDTSCAEIWTGTEWICTGDGDNTNPNSNAETFWLPSFSLPWSTVTNDPATEIETVDLFTDIYQPAFGATMHSAPTYFTSAGADFPVVVPGHEPNTTVATDFYYVITKYDPEIIEIQSLTETGVLTYKKLVPVPPYNAFIKILLVRKI